MPGFNRQRLVFGLYLLVLIAAAELIAGHFKLPAWPAFGEMAPMFFNNTAFMYLTVTGLAMHLPEPSPYLWMAMAGIGGGALIAGVVGIGKLMERSK